MNLNEYLTDNNFEKRDLTILFSVGCVLNTENGDTFPMMEDDTFDFEDGMNVVNDEFDEYWWETLTGNDEVVVKDIIKYVKERK